MTDLYLSAADLATLFSVPKGTIYRWAHEDHWQRTSRWAMGVTRYNTDDAQTSYDRRRP